MTLKYITSILQHLLRWACTSNILKRFIWPRKADQSAGLFFQLNPIFELWGFSNIKVRVWHNFINHKICKDGAYVLFPHKKAEIWKFVELYSPSTTKFQAPFWWFQDFYVCNVFQVIVCVWYSSTVQKGNLAMENNVFKEFYCETLVTVLRWAAPFLWRTKWTWASNVRLDCSQWGVSFLLSTLKR